MTAPTHAPTRVAILAFDGCMASAVSGLLDTFKIANYWATAGDAQASRPFSAQVLTATSNPVRGSCGLLIPATPLQDAQVPDIAIVPPVMASLEATLQANTAIVQWLRQPRAATQVLASVCTGAFFLAEAGVLDQRTATTNPAFAQLFRQRYQQVTLLPEQRLIDHGEVVCAGSTTAFLNLAVFLVARFAGHKVAVLTAKTLCVDMSLPSQLPYFVQVAPHDHGDTAVAALQRWMEQNPGANASTAELAERAAMSPRSLHRRFTQATGLAPLAYLHHLRVESAKRLLETTTLSVEQITDRVGYQDPRAFSRLFRKHSGLGPADYRARFGVMAKSA